MDHAFDCIDILRRDYKDWSNAPWELLEYTMEARGAMQITDEELKEHGIDNFEEWWEQKCVEHYD